MGRLKKIQVPPIFGDQVAAEKALTLSIIRRALDDVLV